MTASPTENPSLPPELLHLIVNEVHHHHDLSQLALTNRTLREFVLPAHIELRTIECAIDDGSMWDLLEANPGYTKLVRSMKVHAMPMQDPPRISRHPSAGLSLTNKRILPLSLLRALSRLQSFEWLSVGGGGSAMGPVSIEPVLAFLYLHADHADSLFPDL